MRITIIAFLVGIVGALMPVVAYAAPEDEDRDFLIRVRGNVAVTASDTVGTVVVIDGDAIIAGTVVHNLVVVHGTATVDGTVRSSITVINGTLNLGSNARTNNVNLVKSTFNRSQGATVTGDVNQRQNIAFRGLGFVFGLVIWIGLTIAALATGLLLAFFGGHQLRGAALALTDNPAGSVLDAVLVVFGLPVLAVLFIVTIVGLPLGVGILLLLLPVALILGYLITATRLGLWITGAMRRPLPAKPYLAAVAGVVVLQLLAIVPGIGWIVVFLAMAWGAGGLLLYAWRAAHARPHAEPTVMAPLSS